MTIDLNYRIRLIVGDFRSSMALIDQIREPAKQLRERVELLRQMIDAAKEIQRLLDECGEELHGMVRPRERTKLKAVPVPSTVAPSAKEGGR